MASFTLNGKVTSLTDDADAVLVDVLRRDAGLTGTKLVCGGGVCGACTVLLDGVPVVSCLLPARTVRDRAVTTVEGIGGDQLHPVQRAFMACDALQCGFCTPGFIVEAAAFHDKWRREKGTERPTRDDIHAALSGHLCRCGAYPGITRAVGEACAGHFDAAEGPGAIGPRVEARDKVTGRAKYTVDIAHPAQLEGGILRSPYAHARVLNVDFSKARALSGVRAAVSLLPRDRVVRFAGQEIAAVAATDRNVLRAALEAIEVRYEPLPAVTGMAQARREGAPTVFPSFRSSPANVSEGPLLPALWRGNLRGPNSGLSFKPRKARTVLAAAKTAADPLLVEGIWRTDGQSHTTLEPHAAVARFDGDMLTVHASTQAAVHLAKLIADRFSLPLAKVRVKADHVGGGFGSKAGLRLETVAAVELARAARAPVRVALDRHEELSVTGHRPAAEVAVALLPRRDGALQALSIVAHTGTGAGVNSTIAALARMIYDADAKELVDWDVTTNLPPGAPFRAPGGPVLSFALEQAVDEAALRMGIDPLVFRRSLDRDVFRQRLYAWAAGVDLWRGRQTNGSERGRYRRGVGVAVGSWLYFWQPGCEFELAVKDGRLIARTATQDIGTGIRSVIADKVAQAFGMSPQEILVEIGDSSLPEGPGAGGSRSTATVVPAALAAADRLKAELARQFNRPIGDNPNWREVIAAAPDTIVKEGRPADAGNTAPGVHSPLDQAGLMGAVFKWVLRRFSHLETGKGTPSSILVAEVEVDTLLGFARVTRVDSGIAVGRIIARDLARSQVEGCIIQGIGYALYESRQTDDSTGQMLATTLEDYRIPGIADQPEIAIHFDEEGFDHVAGGGVGLGEVATVPVAAAIANAVRNATGVRPHEIPIRPDRLVAMLDRERSS